MEVLGNGSQENVVSAVTGSRVTVYATVTLPGGGFFKKIRTGMLKVELKIATISIPRKAWFCDPSLYHFLQKAPNFLANWVLF